MAVYNLYSKRQKALSQPDDVLRYDFIPQKLRVQIAHVWAEMIGQERVGNHAYDLYQKVVRILRKEYGLSELVKGYNSGTSRELNTFFIGSASTDEVLDVVELVMDVAANMFREFPHYSRQVGGVITTHLAATKEINIRFRENAIGFELNDGEIIRIDSQVVHAEAIVPVLTLLREAGFDGPNEEFRDAHAAYRHGDTKAAVLNATKAFESTMKSICAVRSWDVPKGATAKPLIAAIMQNGLFPPYMEAQLNDVQRVLESGVAMLRNKTSGHGDGPTPLVLDEFYARYALNLAATTMLFLVEAHRAKS